MFTIDNEVERIRQRSKDFKITKMTLRNSNDNVTRWTKTNNSETVKNSVIDYAAMNINKDIENTEILIDKAEMGNRSQPNEMV